MTSNYFMRETKPDIFHFRTLGCFARHHVPKEPRREFDAESELGATIDCLPSTQYKVWKSSRQRAVLSRDVTIFENRFSSRKPELDNTDSL